MHFLMHPIVLAVLGSTIGFLLLVAAYLTKRGSLRAFFVSLGAFCLLPAGLVFVLMNPGIFDSRFRPYQTFYKSINIGMTRAEILSLMGQHYPTNGPRQVPKIMEDTPERLGFFMNPEGSTEPNCEGIFLDMKNGIISRKRYSSD
jgi:hypothetical protein